MHKPVPTDPRRFTSRYADLLVAAAGPAMNLLLAIISINAYLLLLDWGWVDLSSSGPRLFFIYLAQINLLLMMFNLILLAFMGGPIFSTISGFSAVLLPLIAWV